MLTLKPSTRQTRLPNAFPTGLWQARGLAVMALCITLFRHGAGILAVYLLGRIHFTPTRPHPFEVEFIMLPLHHTRAVSPAPLKAQANRKNQPRQTSVQAVTQAAELAVAPSSVSTQTEIEGGKYAIRAN